LLDFACCCFLLLAVVCVFNAFVRFCLLVLTFIAFPSICLPLLAFPFFYLLLIAFLCFCLLLLAFACFCLLFPAIACFCLLLLAVACFCLLLRFCIIFVLGVCCFCLCFCLILCVFLYFSLFWLAYDCFHLASIACHRFCLLLFASACLYLLLQAFARCCLLLLAFACFTLLLLVMYAFAMVSWPYEWHMSGKRYTCCGWSPKKGLPKYPPRWPSKKHLFDPLVPKCPLKPCSSPAQAPAQALWEGGSYFPEMLILQLLTFLAPVDPRRCPTKRSWRDGWVLRAAAAFTVRSLPQLLRYVCSLQLVVVQGRCQTLRFQEHLSVWRPAAIFIWHLQAFFNLSSNGASVGASFLPHLTRRGSTVASRIAALLCALPDTLCRLIPPFSAAPVALASASLLWSASGCIGFNAAFAAAFLPAACCSRFSRYRRRHSETESSQGMLKTWSALCVSALITFDCFCMLSDALHVFNMFWEVLLVFACRCLLLFAFDCVRLLLLGNTCFSWLLY